MEEIQSEQIWDKKEDDKEEDAEAEVNIWKYIFGYVEIAVVKCAIELGIADAIDSHGVPMTLSELSSTLGCDPSHLYRIMRFLTHRKIFKEVPASNGSKTYAQTPLSRRLLRNGDHSRAAFVLLENSPVMLAPWHWLGARVLANGTSSFENAHGDDIWSYSSVNLDHCNLINEAMACDTKLVLPTIIESCGEAFNGVNSVVDVGGGNGTAMRELVRGCPWIRCISFDLPHVTSSAPECHGVEHVGGDMFLSVPKADAVFIKWVLHDWGDEECITILKNCREAVPKENGRVIIVEAVIEEGGKEDKLKDVGFMLDIAMMAQTNIGKERTLKEWEYVIEEAGFSRFNVKTIPAVQSVIMAFP